MSIEPIQTSSGIYITVQAEIDQCDERVLLGDIIGQAHVKRVLEIAAAGGHNILFNGAS